MTDQHHAGGSHVVLRPGKGGGPWRYVPLFVIVFVLYLIGYFTITDPRAPLLNLGGYELSWAEILLVLAAVLSLLEQIKVSHPGIDNTLEALSMIGMGVIQLVFFVLGTAAVPPFGIFNNSEFFTLTFVSLFAAVIAVLINARTLRRSIGFGES